MKPLCDVLESIPFLSEIGNSFCVGWLRSNTHTLEVWMLEHYGDPQSWKMLFTVEDASLKEVHEPGYRHCSLLDYSGGARVQILGCRIMIYRTTNICLIYALTFQYFSFLFL